jgi:putative ABC transport system permease protein
MKTVGARSSAINRVYMALIAVFGILAFFLAFPAAALVSNQLVKFLAQTINFRNGAVRFEPLVLALVGGLALVIPQAAAFFPIRQGTHISVREALSGIHQNQSGNDTWIDRRINALQGLPRPFSIALRNVFRRKGRLVLTLITLTLGGAVFISVFNVRVALTNYVDQLSQYFLADVNLTLEQPERVNEVTALLAQLPQIERVEAWGAQRSAVLNADGSTGESLNMIGVPGGSQFIQPIMLSGRWLIAGDENAIVLNDQFQRLFPDLKVGDTLALQVNDRATQWQVVGFFQLAGKIGGLAAYVNEDYLQTLPGMVQGRAANFRIAMNGPASAAQQEALAQAIQTLFEENNMRIADLTTGSRINNTSAAGFNILTSFLLILAILTALVGSIGLAGTMSMNVMDRTREIGVMRSIGASNPILMRMVIVEGLLIGWLSWLLGAILSFPIGQFMSDMVMRALFGSPSPYGFTLIGFALWFVLVSVLSVVASIVPARSAAQLTIREVLAYE